MHCLRHKCGMLPVILVKRIYNTEISNNTFKTTQCSFIDFRLILKGSNIRMQLQTHFASPILNVRSRNRNVRRHFVPGSLFGMLSGYPAHCLRVHDKETESSSAGFISGPCWPPSARFETGKNCLVVRVKLSLDRGHGSLTMS